AAVAVAPVHDDPHIAPVRKPSAQLSVPVQPRAGHYEEEHAYVLMGRTAKSGGRASHHSIVVTLKRMRTGRQRGRFRRSEPQSSRPPLGFPVDSATGL